MSNTSNSIRCNCQSAVQRAQSQLISNMSSFGKSKVKSILILRFKRYFSLWCRSTWKRGYCGALSWFFKGLLALYSFYSAKTYRGRELVLLQIDGPYHSSTLINGILTRNRVSSVNDCTYLHFPALFDVCLFGNFLWLMKWMHDVDTPATQNACTDTFQDMLTKDLKSSFKELLSLANQFIEGERLYCVW